MSNPKKQECKEAVDYFFHENFIEELTKDKRHYVKILLNAVAWDRLYEDLDWGDYEWCNVWFSIFNNNSSRHNL